MKFYLYKEGCEEILDIMSWGWGGGIKSVGVVLTRVLEVLAILEGSAKFPTFKGGGKKCLPS